MEDLVDVEESLYNPATMPASTLGTSKVRRLRRPWISLTLGIAIVVAISIITDIPKPITNAQDVGDQNASLKAINTDLAPCVFALNESLSLYQKNVRGQLTKSNLNQVPHLLSEDRIACSFASGPVYDLTNNIQVTDTKAGTHIDQFLGLATRWSTNHALQAIIDVNLLFDHPNNARILSHLKNQEVVLVLESAQARKYVDEANNILGVTLIEPKLPTKFPSTH